MTGYDLPGSADTIVAPASAPGHSARAILRISGPLAFAALNKVFTPTDPEAYARPGRRIDRGHLTVSLRSSASPGAHHCPALLIRMPAPQSYTKEDVAELILPGSPPLVQAALRGLQSLGVRPARAGEFTLRAFLSGRIDLGQAESVEKMIAARTEEERREAVTRMGGGLSRRTRHWREELLQIAATVEAALDFEDEETGGELENDLRNRLHGIALDCADLSARAERELPPEEGLRVLLAGLTNAGKSSLLNALLGRAAAIISPARSTTRDRTAHPLHLGRWLIRIEDTPGADHGGGALADAATSSAAAHYGGAPLLLLVTDASAVPDRDYRDFIRDLPACRAILIYSKIDCIAECAVSQIQEIVTSNSGIHLAGECRVCTFDGRGIDELKELLTREALGSAATGGLDEAVQAASTGTGESGWNGGLLTRREAGEIKEAADCCAEAADALDLGLELAAVEIRAAYEALARAGGEGYAEEILANIFSRFCIGK